MSIQEVPPVQAPQEVQVPTKAQLEAQLTNLVVQRGQLKDQVEQIERQMPVVNGMIQLLAAQEQVALAASKAEAGVTKD